MRELLVFALSLVAASASAACSSSDPPGPSGASGTGATGGGGAGGEGGAGGSAGSGGSGGGGSCVPGETMSCYGGPSGTQGMGPCQAGIATCNDDGASYGPCVGAVLPSVDVCATADDEDCNGSPAPCAQPWSQAFGDGADQETTSLAFDSAGFLVAGGYFAGSIDVGGGPLSSAGDNDIWVARFDSEGKHAWSKGFGGTMGDLLLGVATDRSSGAVVFTGAFQGTANFGGGILTAGALDAMVVKLDSSGNHVFSKRLGSAAGMDVARAIAIDASGNIVIAGHAPGNEPIDFGGGPVAGPESLFTVKMDSTGKHVFSARYGLGEANAVAFDPSGNVLIGGRHPASIDFGCGPLKNDGTSQLVVAKLSPTGTCIWSNGYSTNGTGAPLLSSIAAGPSGEVFFTGTFYGGSIDFSNGPMTTSDGDADAFLVKLDAGGKLTWSKHFTDSAAPAFQMGNSVAARADGGVLVTGLFSGTTDFGAGPLTALGDVFLAGYASDGASLFAHRYGDPQPNAQTGYAVADNGAGLVAVGGSFTGSFNFGLGPLMSTGGLDAFIAQLAP